MLLEEVEGDAKVNPSPPPRSHGKCLEINIMWSEVCVRGYPEGIPVSVLCVKHVRVV